MSHMNRKKFLQGYTFEIDEEFELVDNAAEWAPSSGGGPQHWGDEHRSFELVTSDPAPERRSDNASFVLSPDKTLMAVATNKVIRIYTTVNHQLRAELVGHLDNVTKMFFAPECPSQPEGAQYMLISYAADYSSAERDDQIIAWYLDLTAKSLISTMPFAIDNLADKAIAAIAPDLTNHHDLSSSAVDEIRGAIVHTLKSADTKNRTSALPTLHGSLSSFGSKPVSADGKQFLHVIHNKSTQSGMRPPDELPQIMIRAFEDLSTEAANLRGHEDAIMWASFSLKDPNVLATASWDQTYQIWNLKDKKASSVIGPTGGQNWSGDFSPDGKHVLLAGTKNVAVYDVYNGSQVAKLEREGLDSWVRNLSWSPAGDVIALCSGIEVILWEPFSTDPQIRQHGLAIVKLTKPENRLYETFMKFHSPKWLDENGKRLAVVAGDGTVLVWDREKNCKWRFQRPREQGMDLHANDIAYVEESQTLVVLSGDGKIREWQLA